MANTTVVGTLRTQLVAETKDFEAALGKSATVAQAWVKDLQAIGTQASTIGQTIATKLGTPLADLGTTARDASTAIQTSLGGMKSVIESSTGDVQKLGDSFRTLATSAPGTAIATNAKTAATAVDGLARSGTGANDAFRQLGSDAPGQIAKVGTAAKDAKGGMGEIVTSAKGIAGALGIGLSVKAVIDFGSAIIEDAGHIADLSAKIGISTEAVQRFGFAAEQTGASMDTIGGAIGKMNVTLAGGDKSTVAALDSIGLKFSDIRAMKPEDAFTAITKAIAAISDPMLQAEAAVKLFGKTGQELLPAIRQGLQDAADAAPVVADRYVQAADRVGDRIGLLKKQALNAGAELIGGLALMVETSHTQIDEMNRHAFQSIEENAKNAKASAAAVRASLGLDKPLTGPDALAGLPFALGGAKTGADELKIATDAMNGLDAATKKNIDSLIALGKSTDEISTKTGVAADVVKLYTDAQKKSADAQKKAADAVAEHKKKILDLAASLSGAGLTQKVKDLDEATKLAVQTWGSGVLESKELVSQVQALGKAGAALTPTLTDVYLKHLDWYGAIDKVHYGIGNLLGDMPNYKKQLDNFMELQYQTFKMPEAKTGIGNIISGLPNLAPQFKQWGDKNMKVPLTTSLGQALGPAMVQAVSQGGGAKNVGKNLGSSVGSVVASEIGKSVGTKFAPAIAKSVGTGLVGNIAGAALSGVTTMGIGLAVQGAVALVGHLTDRKGRKTVEDFADTMGGFDELHKKMGVLGAEGEKMWVKLTQGTNKRDAEGAQKTIDSINAALGKNAEETAAKIAAQGQALEDARGKVGQLQSALQVFGGVVPSALRPSIDSLLQMKGLPDDLKAGLTAVSADPSWQAMQQRASDLGINLQSLGPKFEQAKISDIALGYVRDLGMFSDAGADMTGVLTGMSDELSGMYQEAMASGVALPESIKPYMEELVKMGKLVDANGEKVTDLNTVAFKEIEDKSLKDVVNVLSDIKKLLEKGLPDAAKTGAKDIADNFAKNPVVVPYSYQQQGPSPGGAPPPTPTVTEPQPGLQGGTHGQFVNWGSGTSVTLHGLEAVVPAGEGLGGGPSTITVISQLDGREVARNQVRYIPDALRRAGI